MHVRNSGFEARLAALEAYVDPPKEPRGMTLTARIEAQHQMLAALNENQSEINHRMTRLEGRMDGLEGRMTGVEERLSLVETRLNTIEGTLRLILHEVAALKNMLRPPDDPGEGPALNGSPLPRRSRSTDPG